MDSVSLQPGTCYAVYGTRSGDRYQVFDKLLCIYHSEDVATNAVKYLRGKYPKRNFWYQEEALDAHFDELLDKPGGALLSAD
jgi:hypothetical protein